MNRIGDILRRSMEDLDLGAQVRQQQVIESWGAVAGGRAAANSSAAAIQNGILTVWVPVSLWAVELSYEKEAFLKRMRSRFPDVELRDIRFVVHALPEDTDVAESQEEALSEEPLSSDDVEYIEGEVAIIEAPAMRERLRRLMTAELMNRRAREKMGWKPCLRCGALAEIPPHCPLCAQDLSRERMSEAAGILIAMPWLGGKEMQEMVPGLTRGEFEGVLQKLIMSLWTDMQEIYAQAPKDERLKRESRVRCLTYCMLKSGMPPHALDEETIRYHLGVGLYALFSLSNEATEAQ